MENLLDRLFELGDIEYASLQVKLTPVLTAENIIGVRVPDVRKLAKELYRSNEYKEFLSELPHKYYDENMLHGLIVSEIRDYDECLNEIDRFLPFVDNWAVCDSIKPKSFKKKEAILFEKIKQWTCSDKVYTCRFGIDMLMSYFLDENFTPDILEIPASIRSDEYYINMATAWFFATALAKQWDSAFPYLVNNRLDIWTHNKTIQKARESFRITPEHKEILKELKRK